MKEPNKLSFHDLRAYNEQRDGEFKARVSSAKEWNIVDRSNELAGEVGELCNMAKKIRRARLGMHRADVTEEDIAKELADVIICADLLAMDMGIDLDYWVPEKFNRSSDKFGLQTKMPVGYWQGGES